MSSRSHDSKQAPKLPQFPARKGPARAVGQSPARGNRVEALPGVLSHGRSPGRADPLTRGRTGVEKLAQFSRRPEASPKGAGEVHDACSGFDSPQAARTRAQVARDEVLSYMQQRRFKSAGGVVQAPSAGQDISYDKDESHGAGDEDVVKGSSSSILRDWHVAAAVTADTSREPRTGHQAAARPFADDDLVASSTDQSPTRHAHRDAEDTVRGSAARLEATASVSLGGVGTDAYPSVPKRHPPSSLRGSILTSMSKGGMALTEDAFDFFKREVAARVIQTHWRKWQAWKAKVRSEAEERILQQLLSDDSGLSLRLLLNGEASSGDLSLALPSQPHRPDASARITTPAGGLEVVPPQPTLGRVNSLPAPTERASRAQAARVAGPDAGRPTKPRPVSAVESRALVNRGRSPARPRTTAPAALSPAHGTPGRMRPSAHRGGVVGQGLGLYDGDSEGELWRGGNGDAHKPQRKLVGGHAVYTFVATPRRSSATTGPPACAVDDDSCGSAENGGAPEAALSRASTQQAWAEPPRRQAEPTPPTDQDDNNDPMAPPNGAPFHRQQPGPCLSRQLQPSLDADTNPAMASPALSAANSNADSMFGPASPATSALEATSRNARLPAPVCQHPQAAPCPQQQQQRQQQPRPQSEDQGAVQAGGPEPGRSQQPRRPELVIQTDGTPPASPSGQAEGQQEQLPLACSPSPQRQTRSEALQRLKRQGSQRLSALGPSAPARPPSGLPAAQTALDAAAANPREEGMNIEVRSVGAEADGYIAGGVTDGGRAHGGHLGGGVTPAGQGGPGEIQGGERRREEGQLGREPREDSGPQDRREGVHATRVQEERIQEWSEERGLHDHRGVSRRQLAQPMQQEQPIAMAAFAADVDERQPYGNNKEQQHRYGREREGASGARNQPQDRGEGNRTHMLPYMHPQQPQPQHHRHQQELNGEASLRSIDGYDASDCKRQHRGANWQSGAPPEGQRRAERQQGRDGRGHQEAGGRQPRPQHAGQPPSTWQASDEEREQPPEKECNWLRGEERNRPQRHAEGGRRSSGAPDGGRLTLIDSCSADSCKDGTSGAAPEPSRNHADDIHHARPSSTTSTCDRATRSTTHAQRSLFHDDSDSSSGVVHEHTSRRHNGQQQDRDTRAPGQHFKRDAWATDDAISAARPQYGRPSQQRQPHPASASSSTRTSAGGGAAAGPGHYRLTTGRDAELQEQQHPGNDDGRANVGSKGAAAAPAAALNPSEFERKRNAPSSSGDHDLPGPGPGGAGVLHRPGAGVGTDRPGVGGIQQRTAVDVSVTAEKMTSILKYLEEVELQAEQEATCAAIAPALLVTEPTAAAAVAAALLPGAAAGHRALGQARRYVTTTSAASTGAPAATGSSRPGTAQTAVSQLGLQANRSQAAFNDALLPGLNLRRRRSRSSRRRTTASPGRAAAGAAWEDGEGDDEGDLDDDDDGAASVATASAVSGVTGRPAFLAESVYENVRTKIRRLQDEVKQRDTRITELSQEVEALQAAQRTSLMEADARLSEMLAAQRAEYEAAVSRHLAFVDRLLADKEALASRAEQLTEQLKGAEERQDRAIAKLKEGWAAELKRQKESWAAAEKQRREAWMQSKAAEIKDVTVKGLEGEVQKLLSRHRAELSAAQQAAADEARRHLDTYVAQNEAAVRQLKERMSREAEEAVEKERAAAATRLREVSERYEQQLQTQRMRLVADADLRLEQLEQARKEDKKRYEEGLSAAREAGEGRLREAEDDWRREKEALRKAHDKQIEALREQYETGQEGWRAAMADRARKEVAERVAAIREKLLQERNEEVQAVMTRLEVEHASAVEALKEDFRRREEAAAARAAASLKEARRAEAKMAERFRNAGLASKTAEDRLAASELTAQELRRELESKNNTIRWLEAQVTTAKEEAVARERDVRSLGAEKAAVAAEVAAAVARDKQQVEARLAQALQEAQELRSRHSAEMAAVEARVRATLARKDEVIGGLREQLTAMAAELRTTQEVLRQQQEELGSELDGGGGMGPGSHRDGGGRRGGRY